MNHTSHGRNCPAFRRPIVTKSHYDGKRLIPWENRPNTGAYLIVMRTNSRGARTLIEQTGHPIPPELAAEIGARVIRAKGAR